MRVEALALLGRYAGADRRSGLVPPCWPAPARIRQPGRPRGSGTRAAVIGESLKGHRVAPAARMALSHASTTACPAFTPATSDCQFYIRSIIALGHSWVRRARRKWMRPSEEAHAVMRSAYAVRRETRV